MSTKTQLWAFPWGYRESLLFVTGIIITGFGLQLFIGEFNFFLLHKPVNYGVAVLICILGAVLASAKSSNIAAWLGGVPFAVALMVGLLFLTLLMGTIPQVTFHNFHDALWVRLGLTKITHCWPFVFLYLLLLLSLSIICFKRCKRFSKRNILFLLNHGGLWVALLAAGLGSADMQRHIMHVQEGAMEWRVYAENNDVLELPLAIRLHDFDIEEYPPKLAIIDKEKGIPLPEGKAEWLQLDTKPVFGALGEWDITTNTYIHDAVWGGNNSYREMRMPGSSPAVQITAKNRKTGAVREGWVSGGNMAQFMSALSLDDKLAVVMAQPEPKRFISDISVAAKNGDTKRALLEVNSPLRMGSWIIYQYGYDNKAGKLSTYSSFELVYDPWLWLVYLGLILMSAGAFMLVWAGKKKRGETL